MASFFSMSAVAALILSATAPVSAAAAYSNGTYHSGGPYHANDKSIEAAFCAAASGHVVEGFAKAFAVVCGEVCEGNPFFPPHLPSNYTKRAYEQPQSLQNCLNICGEYDGCVAASFDDATFTCAYYSTFEGTVSNQPGLAYGVVTSLEQTPVGAGDSYPSVVYAPSTTTVLSCAATVTNCPLRAVVTDYYPVTTTVCPATAATSIPATPIACDCAYTASAVAVVSCSTGTVNGVATTSYVTVSSATINFPLVKNYATSPVSGAASTAAGLITGTVKVASASATASASGPEAFTGGAAQKAGFGAAAVLAGAAMIL